MRMTRAYDMACGYGNDKRPVEKRLQRSEIPKLEIISDKTSADLVYSLLKEHGELALFQIGNALNLPPQTVVYGCRQLERKGLAKSRFATAKIDGVRRKVHLFSVNSQDSKKQR